MGSWRNIIEMEESLTLEELTLLVDSGRKAEHRRNKFAAGLKGVDLDEHETATDFDEVQRKAQAALAGQSEEEFVFDMIGIEMETDDDD